MIFETLYKYDIKVWSGSLFPQTDYEGRSKKPIEYKYLPSSNRVKWTDVRIFSIYL